jgi:hypothetical protein
MPSKNTQSSNSKKSGIPLPIVLLLAAVAAALVWTLLKPATASAQHPTPRPGITAVSVMDATRFAQPQVAAVYAEAKEIPDVLDGIYCHCDCHIHAGHRSLLSCFESAHGSSCDICMGEAHLAYQMHKQGKSLQEIRAAVDAQFGHG